MIFAELWCLSARCRSMKIESSFSWLVGRVKWIESNSTSFIGRYASNPMTKSKKSAISSFRPSIAIPTEKLISPNFSVCLPSNDSLEPCQAIAKSFASLISGGYAITSLGTTRQKLDYVFALYDKDKNNSIDRKEMVRVISAMYDLLGKSKIDYPPERCVDDVFSLIDVNNDRTLTKDEFIDGVLKNPYLSDIISPFNE